MANGDCAWGRAVKLVLLIEDDDAIAEVVEIVMQDAGYEVERATTVAAALTVVEGTSPAVALLDLTLPGISGLAFLRSCRESDRLAGLPIVMLTGSPHPRLEAGFSPDAVLLKPFDIDHLAATVDRLAGSLRPPVGEIAG